MSKNPTFKCIYCWRSGPDSFFDDEHVLSRSLCGQGNNWTLKNQVCKCCNSRFSKFENELLQQSAETVARAFSGPLGRSAKSNSGKRIQPLKINHLYVRNNNDPLIYEAGFSFPSEFYFRPQIIDAGNGQGLIPLVTSASEQPLLQAAVLKLFASPIRLTLPRTTKDKDYEIVEFNQVSGIWQEISRSRQDKPSSVFLREFQNVPFTNGATTRLALYDDGNLYFRAENLLDIIPFIEQLVGQKFAHPSPQKSNGPGNQEFLFGLSFNLIKIYKAILKTGVNLVAHFYGQEVISSGSLRNVRDILLEDKETTRAGTICRLSAAATLDFPLSQTDT
ncbi:MAG: hypothetical protein NTZ72_12980 [Afipia sp.]|nr:hypothetical protein [Afipia sp.]